MSKTLKDELMQTPEGQSQLVTAQLQRQYETVSGPRSINYTMRDRAKAALQAMQQPEQKPA